MRSRLTVTILAALFLPVCLLALAAGASGISWGEIIRSVLSGDVSSAAYRIAVYVRLPRVAGALLAGASLAAAGYIMQGALLNPLASPGLIGVNAGAALGALLAGIWLPKAAFSPAICAFCGALISAVCVYLIAHLAGASRRTVILAGVAVSALINAVTDAVIALAPQAASEKAMFTVGSLATVTYPELLHALPFAAAGLAGAFVMRRELTMLSLGDEAAGSLGVRVRRARFILIVCAALLAGAAVSFAGVIGFVGLIVPHAVRMLSGSRHRLDLTASVLLGGELCVLCDLIARTLFSPYEIPVGIVLSVVGVPCFLYLLFRGRNMGGETN